MSSWRAISQELDRSWEWRYDLVTFRVWMHLLLNATNYRGKKMSGIALNRGQYLTSYRLIAVNCGIMDENGNPGIQQVRTAIKHLKQSSSIVTENVHLPNTPSLLITITEWDSYQFDPEQSNTPLTPHKHPINTPLTPNRYNTEDRDTSMLYNQPSINCKQGQVPSELVKEMNSLLPHIEREVKDGADVEDYRLYLEKWRDACSVNPVFSKSVERCNKLLSNIN